MFSIIRVLEIPSTIGNILFAVAAVSVVTEIIVTRLAKKRRTKNG
jgi:hypothetical protein